MSLPNVIFVVATAQPRRQASRFVPRDLEMFAEAGLGVAMGNAVPSVKAAAGLVAPTNDEDGVARVLEDVILSGGRRGAGRGRERWR